MQPKQAEKPYYAQSILKASFGCLANAQRSLTGEGVGNYAAHESNLSIPVYIRGGGLNVPMLLTGTCGYKPVVKQFKAGQKYGINEAKDPLVTEIIRIAGTDGIEAVSEFLSGNQDKKEKVTELFRIIRPQTHQHIADLARQAMKQEGIPECYIPEKHNKPLWSPTDYHHNLIILADKADIGKVKGFYNNAEEGQIIEVSVPLPNLETRTVESIGPVEVQVPHASGYHEFCGDLEGTFVDNPSGGIDGAVDTVRQFMDLRKQFIEALMQFYETRVMRTQIKIEHAPLDDKPD